MSELVEDNFFANFQSNFSLQSSPQCNINDIFNGLIISIERANTQGYNFKIQQSAAQRSQGILHTIVHLRFTSSMFDLVIEIFVNIKKKKLQLKTSFLEKQEYLLTQTNAKRKIICRKLLRINNQIQLQGLKYIQNMQNGKISLLSVTQQSQTLFSSRQQLWTRIKNTIKTICQISNKYSLQLYQYMNKQRYKKLQLKNGGEQLKKIKKQELSYTKLVKQLEVSHINFGFSATADQTSFPTYEKSHQHQHKLKQFITNASCERFQVNTRKLLCTDFQEFLNVPSHFVSYEMEHNQTKLYSSYLKTPVPRDPNPGQNKFIFNHIEIVKPQTVKFRDTLYQGGMSKLYASRISYYYCESSSYKKPRRQTKESQSRFTFRPVFIQAFKTNESAAQRSNPVLTKMIAVKVPKRRPTQKWDQKYQNEKNIIKLFKSGVSAYVLKYYVSTQLNFEYKDCLLLDFLPNSHPLSNYIQIYQNTLSLNSKAYLIVNLVNSLRFLNDYQIVHMDLNLNNVLVYRDYLTKLIDFGEAYSPNMNSSGAMFKRGYTFPFCAPEYFERKTNFLSKQDVFSLGIIMWRIIFNDYPFFASTQALQFYKNKTYLKKIMLAPQRGQAYGNVQTVDFIYRLIFKCLSPNQMLRCETSWLTIFFKIIYFYLL